MRSEFFLKLVSRCTFGNIVSSPVEECCVGLRMLRRPKHLEDRLECVCVSSFYVFVCLFFYLTLTVHNKKCNVKLDSNISKVYTYFLC